MSVNLWTSWTFQAVRLGQSYCMLLFNGQEQMELFSLNSTTFGECVVISFIRYARNSFKLVHPNWSPLLSKHL